MYFLSFHWDFCRGGLIFGSGMAILGALLAGLFISLVKKEFKLVLLYYNWIKYKGTSKRKRIVFFIFLFFMTVIME